MPEPLTTAVEAFIQTTTLEEAYAILEKYPELLTDRIDILFSVLIQSARQQGLTETVRALDERRDFLRNVRQEEGKDG